MKQKDRQANIALKDLDFIQMTEGFQMPPEQRSNLITSAGFDSEVTSLFLKFTLALGKS